MTGGAVQVWVTPSLTGKGGGTVLFAGGARRFGTAQTVNAAGAPDTKGGYKQVVVEARFDSDQRDEVRSEKTQECRIRR